MKKVTVILLVIIAVLLGYIAGNMLPLNLGATDQQGAFSLPQFGQKGIEGDAVLQVTLEMEDTANPLANVEVDLAEEPGPPPVGGTALSDDNGVATFNVKPGNYFVFFNDNNFPKNLEAPEPQAVEVKADEENQIKILISLK
jgi:hypothetical protein